MGYLLLFSVLLVNSGTRCGISNNCMLMLVVVVHFASFKDDNDVQKEENNDLLMDKE
jgi:hypothetical protein